MRLKEALKFISSSSLNLSVLYGNREVRKINEISSRFQELFQYKGTFSVGIQKFLQRAKNRTFKLFTVISRTVFQ